MRERGAGALTVILVLAAGLLVALLALHTVSSRRVEQVRDNWSGTLGSWDEIMQRFPAREANATALQLERVAAELGIDIVPRAVSKGTARVRPTPESVKSFNGMRKQQLAHYYESHLEREELGKIDAPPEELVRYIEEHSTTLSELRELLRAGESPLWSSDLSKLWGAPIPNLLGQINLHKLLTGVAFARLNAGDVEGALENIDASYRLVDSLRDSPILINQLILLHTSRMQLGVLRHVPDLPASWIERMQTHDHRDSFLTAMKYEGWVWAQTDGEVDEEVAWRHLARPILRPYNELCLADLSEQWRERLSNLEQVAAICDRDLTSEGASLDSIEVPRWNVLGKTIIPNLENAIYRLARLELDLELTRLIQEARSSRLRDGGWPAGNASEIRSTECPGDRWIYAVDGDGLQIELSRSPGWQNVSGPVLPTRVVMR